jgi:hypothetical protein
VASIGEPRCATSDPTAAGKGEGPNMKHGSRTTDLDANR